MNSKLLALTASAVVVGFASTASAQFDIDFTTGYTGNNTSLAGQNGWTTNDPLSGDPGEEVGDTSFVIDVPGLSYGSNNSALFGGVNIAAPDNYIPGNPAPELVYDFTPVATTLTDPYVRFTTDFAIVNPNTVGFENLDAFGFDLRDAGGNSITKLMFNPPPATPPITAGYDLRFNWELNGVQQDTSNPALLAYFDGAYSQLYRLQVDLSETAFNATIFTLNPDGSVDDTMNVIIGGALSGGLNGLDFAQLAIVWDITDTTIGTNPSFPTGYSEAGSNYIGLNSIGTAAVPEPSAIGLAALGGLGLLVARRRKKA